MRKEWNIPIRSWRIILGFRLMHLILGRLQESECLFWSACCRNQEQFLFCFVSFFSMWQKALSRARVVTGEYVVFT